MNLLQGKSILVVEDEALIREILAETFALAGAKVTEAENGAVAFTKLASAPFDIVISDVRMPGGGGLELMQRIKREVAHPPKLFFCSGFNDVTPEQMRETGVLHIFSKPFDTDDIVSVLAKAVA